MFYFCRWVIAVLLIRGVEVWFVVVRIWWYGCRKRCCCCCCRCCGRCCGRCDVSLDGNSAVQRGSKQGRSCPDHPSPPRASRRIPPLGFRWGQTTYPSPAPHNSGGDSGLRVLARTRLDPGCRACLSRGVVVKSSLPEFHHLLIQRVLPTYLGSSL